MNHIITLTNDLAPLAPDLLALAQSRGLTTTPSVFELEDTVLRAGGFAWDIGDEAAPLRARIAELQAAKAEADAAEAVRIAALPPPVPSSLTPAQMRIVLALHGISHDAIAAMISGLPEPTKTIASVRWEYALEFRRDDPVLGQVGAGLGMTPEQIDALFREGANY